MTTPTVPYLEVGLVEEKYNIIRDLNIWNISLTRKIYKERQSNVN